MLRRLSTSLFLLIAALLIVGAFGSATLAADESASVSPGGGSLHTAFTLAVQGMQPGHGVTIVLYDAAGNRYTYQQGGVDQAIVVDANGQAAMTLTPATDLPGAVAGTWTAVFTEQETGNSATIQFDVSA